jgi:hypothetical protein
MAEYAPLISALPAELARQFLIRSARCRRRIVDSVVTASSRGRPDNDCNTRQQHRGRHGRKHQPGCATADAEPRECNHQPSGGNHFCDQGSAFYGEHSIEMGWLKAPREALICRGAEQARLTESGQAARLSRISANAALPARVASDIVSKKSDCRTALLLPAA